MHSVESLTIFLRQWFFVKSNLAILKSQKLPSLQLQRIENLIFEDFGHGQMQKLAKIQNSRASKTLKDAKFEFLKIDFTSNLSGRKILSFAFWRINLHIWYDPQSVWLSPEDRFWSNCGLVQSNSLYEVLNWSPTLLECPCTLVWCSECPIRTIWISDLGSPFCS